MIDLKGKKVLHLTVSAEPFEVMHTGEKQVEFRKDSDWIRSRLYNKDGTAKVYDYVKFVNGYGKDKPYFITIYRGISKHFNKRGFAEVYDTIQYSNGLRIDTRDWDYSVHFGKIVEVGNINNKLNTI